MVQQTALPQLCCDLTLEVIQEELSQPTPDLTRVSVLLGAIETPLTRKEEALQCWPENLQAQVCTSLEVFQGFVQDANQHILAASTSLDARGKVKLVADLVWSRLSGAFAKDILHGQHVFAFTSILQLSAGAKGKAKRQLDCGGVVTTVLAACKQLARHHGHQDLAGCRFQVSEDHCWMTLSPEGGREATVEVTTDTAAKRALPVEEKAWGGWLYSGGDAVLCSPQQAVTALIVSLDPSIIARQNSGVDSEQLQDLQRRLLELVQQEHPEAMYPAALCALADLKEIQAQDALEAAAEAGDSAGVDAALQDHKSQAEALFGEAIRLARQAPLGDHQWYPYSYLFGHLMRRAKTVASEVARRRAAACSCGDAEAASNWRELEEEGYRTAKEALRWVGSSGGAAVLRKYRFAATDEQLYKDVEGVVEACCECMRHLQLQQQQQSYSGGSGADSLSSDASWLVPLLELWDGVCCLFSGHAKPAAWLSQLLRAAKCFSTEARVTAAQQAQVVTEVMRAAEPHWGALKPTTIKPLFESADVTASDLTHGRSAKRNRHS